MCIGIIWNNSFLVGGRDRAEARIDPRPLRTSHSTAHGAQVVWPLDYMGRAHVPVVIRTSMYICKTPEMMNDTAASVIPATILCIALHINNNTIHSTQLTTLVPVHHQIHIITSYTLPHWCTSNIHWFPKFFYWQIPKETVYVSITETATLLLLCC